MNFFVPVGQGAFSQQNNTVDAKSVSVEESGYKEASSSAFEQVLRKLSSFVQQDSFSVPREQMTRSFLPQEGCLQIIDTVNSVAQRQFIEQLVGKHRIRFSETDNKEIVALYLEKFPCTEEQLVHILNEAPHLKILHLNGNCNLHALPQLPKTIELLSLEGCDNLVDISQISSCSNLQVLNVAKTPVAALPPLTCSLISLDAHGCGNLFDIRTLSSCTSLQVVNLAKTKILSLVFLPLHIETLNVAHCTNIKSFAKLTQFSCLKKLNLSYTSVAELPKLSHSLISLELKGCTNVTDIQCLDANSCPSLQFINLSKTAIQKLPYFSQTLEFLALNKCHKLLPIDLITLTYHKALTTVELGELFAPQLQTQLQRVGTLTVMGFLVTLFGDTSIRISPNTFALTEIAIESGQVRKEHLLYILHYAPMLDSLILNNSTLSCEELCEILAVVPALKTLKMQNNLTLTQLPLLPKFLEVLDCFGCRNLASVASLRDCSFIRRVNLSQTACSFLGPLSKSLEKIDLDGCSRLLPVDLLFFTNRPQLQIVLDFPLSWDLHKVGQYTPGKFLRMIIEKNYQQASDFAMRDLIRYYKPDYYCSIVSQDGPPMAQYLLSRSFLSLPQVPALLKASLLIAYGKQNLIPLYCSSCPVQERLSFIRELVQTEGVDLGSIIGHEMFNDIRLNSRHFSYSFPEHAAPTVRPAPVGQTLMQRLEVVLEYISPTWPDTHTILDDPPVNCSEELLYRYRHTKTEILNQIRVHMQQLQDGNLVDRFLHSISTANQKILQDMYGNIFYTLITKIDVVRSLQPTHPQRLSLERKIRSFVQQLGITFYHCGDRLKTDSTQYYNTFVGNEVNSLDAIESQELEMSINLELLLLRRQVFNEAYFSMTTDEHDASTQRLLLSYFNVPFGLNEPQYNSSDVWTDRYALARKRTEMAVLFRSHYTLERIVEHLTKVFVTKREPRSGIIIYPWYNKIQEYLTVKHPDITDWSSIFNFDAETYTFKGLHPHGMTMLLFDIGVLATNI